MAKMILKHLIILYFFAGFLSPSNAQQIQLKFNRIFFDGRHYKASLVAIRDNGYVPGSDLLGNWIGMNIRLDIENATTQTSPGSASIQSVVITNRNRDHVSSANIALVSPGTPTQPNTSQLSINILRDNDLDDLPNDDNGVEFFQFEITFSEEVEAANLVYVRPYLNVDDPNGSFWSNPSADVIRRPFRYIDPFPLPVKLISFNAMRENGIAGLRWETTEESNADRFEVQRSMDGKAWNPVGSVKAKGESNALLSYVFQDLHPLQGNNYYRLKMIDLDGTFAYSAIRNLNFSETSTYRIFPNPASEMLQIEVERGICIAKVAVSNSAGTKVFESSELADGKINVSKFPVGIYVLKIDYKDGLQARHKILINR